MYALGEVLQKPWGTTQCILQRETTSVHVLRAKAGHRCSYHCHRHAFNRFFVVSGVIRVLVGDRAYDLRSGEKLDVEPGVFHEFQCLEDAVVVECCFMEAWSASDISRADSGGRIEDREAEPKLLSFEQRLAAEMVG